ncbi:MAG TPA: glycosyltransferase family 2 protein [Vitreimonas sp.]|nr:glycosyltransferase family 2 protein [Vitreimonas sp.]
MISVVLATHNEAKNLPRCLEAVKDFADEIIIVDGESTDETVAIAKTFKAKVIKTTNKANFHINKQMAMDEARGELVLQLDADEVVDDDLALFIRDLHHHLREDNDHYNAWLIKRKNLFLGRFLSKGGQYPDPVIRLYRSGKAWLPQKDVHEQMHVEGQTGWAEGHLTHYANPTFEDYMRKFNTYTSFKAVQLDEAKLSINLLTGLHYLVWKPFATLFMIFIRHKGFVDGVPGFVFALMSGLHHAFAYLKLWEIREKRRLKL